VGIFPEKKKKKKMKLLKKRELIRIANVDKKIDSMHDQIIELVLLLILKASNILVKIILKKMTLYIL